ncbi:MAG: 23S rRNA (adenine(2030)-N(6))-methyltransferase RlmJ [Gammaproteobacteria bacterium]|nr:23S rRNA (adenine(2030)-N(6))-methyltransferase RlmJ [Gammaproteobacteria bacterium]
MLSYQHDYHAGNHADVLKHSVLALVVRALQRKDAPLRVLDAHAGSGVYDLRSNEARKNEEFAGGIRRLLAAAQPPAAVQDYLAAVRALNAGRQELDLYPGSPQVVRHLLRPEDHLELLELHPAALARLHRNFGRDHRVHIHDRDAFEGVPALVPPREKRGAVLVDSSYEVKEDFTTVIELLQTCHRRWPGGVYLLWYPVIRHPLAERFTAKVRATGLPKILQAELRVEAEGFDGMRGSGLCIVNPPFGLDQKLNALLPWLWATLKNDDRSGWRVEWLTPS